MILNTAPPTVTYHPACNAFKEVVRLLCLLPELLGQVRRGEAFPGRVQDLAGTSFRSAVPKLSLAPAQL
jgi:hypothetical protein